MKRVLAAMSGGVDSSVAALLLKQQGYDVHGITMDLGIESSAVEDAEKVCDYIGISHEVIDLSSELKEYVIKDFIAEYSSGRTPNPCARCNENLKFARLWERAQELGCDRLATGHYVRLALYKGNMVMCRPKDRRKDQTYFLHGINKDVLKYIIFPIADYTKDALRKIAADAGLPVAGKAESQDICFVKDDYKQFLKDNGLAQKTGKIVDLDGKVLGVHNGIINFTRGQRGGLGIALGKPAYVVNIDAENDCIVVGGREDLLSDTLYAGKRNNFVEEFPEKLTAKIRYGHQDAACKVEFMDGDTVRVMFEEKQSAVTPGQSVVFYDGDVLLGGARIESAG